MPYPLRSAAAAIALSAGLGGVAGAQAQTARYDVSAMPAGVYEIDKTHAYITFTYSHLGFSHPTLRFDEFASSLTLDPENVENSSVEATIETASVDSNVARFDDHLRSPELFDAAQYPQITFHSTRLTRLSDTKGELEGELNLHGVTLPVVLDITFNGGAAHPFDDTVRVLGFDATTTVKRSDFGIAYAIPAVGDEVTINISAEYHYTEQNGE